MSADERHGLPRGGGSAPNEGRAHVEIEFEIPSDLRWIERVVETVQRQCEEFAYSPRQCALNVPVALSEALSNAILRGNHEDPAKSVRVRAEVDADALVVEVGDEGEGFDLDERAAIDPRAPENLVKENGRGLFLMTKLMDTVERVAATGNVVRLTMRRA